MGTGDYWVVDEEGGTLGGPFVDEKEAATWLLDHQNAIPSGAYVITTGQCDV